MRRLLFSVLAASLFVAPAAQAASITFSTDQTGANTQIDLSEDEIWTFNVTSGTLNDVFGKFVIKRGPNTDLPITFSLFSGTPPAGAAIANMSLYSSDDADPPCPGALCVVTQTYTQWTFPLTVVNIGPGSYYVRLSSNAPSNGANQYFFKNGGLVNKIECAPGEAACGEIALSQPVPEPTSMSLLGFGLLAAARRIRRQQ